MDNKSIGIRLQGLLRERRITQKSFAEQIGVAKETVNKWCKGVYEIRDYNVTRISEILEVRREYIQCLDNYKTESDLIEAHQNMTAEEQANILRQSWTILNEVGFVIQYAHITQLLNSEQFKKHDLSGIKDVKHFCNYLESEIHSAIESYITFFNNQPENNE